MSSILIDGSMSESFRDNEMPGWQDISLQEIKALLEDEQYKKAMMFARLRLDGISGMPTEIDKAIADPLSEVPVDAWQLERERYLQEIAVLEALIQKYNN